MNTPNYRTQKNKRLSISNDNSGLRTGGESALNLEDNRPESIAQRKLQDTVLNRSNISQRKIKGTIKNSANVAAEPIIQRQLQPVAGGNFADTRNNAQSFTMYPAARVNLDGYFGDGTGFYYYYTQATRQYQVYPLANNVYWDITNQRELERQIDALGNDTHIYVRRGANVDNRNNRYKYNMATHSYTQAPTDRARWVDENGEWVDNRFRVLTPNGQDVRKEYAVTKDAALNYVLPHKLRSGFMAGLPNLFGGNVDPGETGAEAITRETNEESYWGQNVTNVGADLNAPAGTPAGYRFREATVAARAAAGAAGAAATAAADITHAVTAAGVLPANIAAVVAAVSPFVTSPNGGLGAGGVFLSYTQFQLRVRNAAIVAGATAGQADILKNHLSKPETSQGTFNFRAHQFPAAMINTAAGLPAVPGGAIPTPPIRANAKLQIKNRILTLFYQDQGIIPATDAFLNSAAGLRAVADFRTSHSIEVLVAKIIADNRQYNQGVDGAAPAHGATAEYTSGYNDYRQGFAAARVAAIGAAGPPGSSSGFSSGFNNYSAGVIAARAMVVGAGAPPGSSSGFTSGFNDYQGGIAAAQGIPGLAPVLGAGNHSGFRDGYNNFRNAFILGQNAAPGAAIPAGNPGFLAGYNAGVAAAAAAAAAAPVARPTKRHKG